MSLICGMALCDCTAACCNLSALCTGDIASIAFIARIAHSLRCSDNTAQALQPMAVCYSYGLCEEEEELY